MAMARGTIKFFNKEKRYGFITSEDYEKDIFFHETEQKNKEELTEDDKVMFQTRQTKRGLQGVNIIKIKKDNSKQRGLK